MLFVVSPAQLYADALAVALPDATAFLGAKRLHGLSQGNVYEQLRRRVREAGDVVLLDADVAGWAADIAEFDVQVVVLGKTSQRVGVAAEFDPQRPLAELVELVKAVRAGTHPLPDPAEARSQSVDAARLASLTARERRILELLAEGWSAIEAAEREGVKISTVRAQIKSMFKKLEVTSQLGAVAAFRRVTDNSE